MTYTALRHCIERVAGEVRSANDNLRYGQTLFNALHLYDPGLADKIRSTSADPFYTDTRVSVFWEKIRQLKEAENV